LETSGTIYLKTIIIIIICMDRDGRVTIQDRENVKLSTRVL